MQWPQFNSTSLSFFPLRTSVCFCLIESLQSQGEGGCQRAGEPAVLLAGTMQRTGVQANKESRAWETKIIENKEAQRRKPGVVWCSALGVGQFFIKQCQRLRSSVKRSWKEKWDLAISPHWVNKTRNSTLPRRERSLVSTPVVLVCLGPWQSCTLGTRGETEVGPGPKLKANSLKVKCLRAGRGEPYLQGGSHPDSITGSCDMPRELQ